MADDNLYSLLIKVEGGDAAAAEIIKSQYALKAVEGESDALKNKFQEGFQHVALKGFIGDLARTSGLGGEARLVIGMLNTGVTALGESFGILGTDMALATAGLTALAALAFVAYEHFSKHAESLEQVSEGQVAALATTDELKDALKRQADVVGPLTGSTLALAKATNELDAAQRGTLAGTTAQIIAQAQEKIRANKELIASDQELMEQARRRAVGGETGIIQQHDVTVANGYAATIRKLYDEIAAADQVIAKGKADIEARAQGYKDAADRATKLADAQEKLSESSKKASDQLVKDTKEARLQADQEAQAVTDAAAKMAEARQSLADKTKVLQDEQDAATQNAQQKRTAAIQKFVDESAKVVQGYEKQIEAARQYGLDTAAMEQQLAAYQQQVQQVALARTRQNYGEMATAGIGVAKSIGDSFAQMEARNLLANKSAHDMWITLSADVKQEVLADLIKIGVQHELTAAIAMLSATKTAAAGAASSTAQTAAASASASAQVTAIGTVAAAKATASAAAVTALGAETAAVVALTGALTAATAAAIALDAALAVAA